MSDIQKHLTPVVDDTPAPSKRPRLIQELDDKIQMLDEMAANHINSLNDDITALYEAVQALFALNGALLQAVSAMADDPGSPHAGAAKARDLINAAQEAAYGPAEGPEDDGVVSESEGDTPGDA